MTLPYEIPGIDLLYSETAHNYNVCLIIFLIAGSICVLATLAILVYQLCTHDYEGIIVNIIFVLLFGAFVTFGWCCLDSFTVYTVNINDTLSFLDFEKYYRIYEKVSDSVYKIIAVGG